MQTAPADAATAAHGNGPTPCPYVNGMPDRFPELHYQSWQFLEQVHSRLGTNTKAAVQNQLSDFTARKASKRDTYFAIFKLLGNHAELRNGLHELFSHSDASWAEQDFEYEPAPAPSRQPVPDILEPQHTPQFTLPSMMHFSGSWLTSSINPDVLSNTVGTYGTANGDLAPIHPVDPFHAGPEHMPSYHDNNQGYHSASPFDDTSAEHFSNGKPMCASGHPCHSLNLPSHEPLQHHLERTLPNLPGAMLPSQRSYSLNETLSAVQYHHGRQNWVDESFYNSHRSLSMVETPRMSVPRLDSPNKSSIGLSPSVPQTPSQTLFSGIAYEPASGPHAESASDNCFQNGWQETEQKSYLHANDQGFFKQQTYTDRNEQEWSPRAKEQLAVPEPVHMAVSLRTTSPQPSTGQDTDAELLRPHHHYVHSLCGKAFPSRHGVKKHHWGGRLGNRETVTGCWAKHGKPDVEWDAHPSCKEHTAKPSAPKGTNRQAQHNKPKAPAAFTMVSHNHSSQLPVQQESPRVVAETFNDSPPLPFREGAQIYHNHQLPRLELPGISDALLTVVNAASDINAPRAQTRNDSVVQHSDAQATVYDPLGQLNHDIYHRNPTHGWEMLYPLQSHDGYRTLAPAPSRPSLSGGLATDGLDPTELPGSVLAGGVARGRHGLGDTKRSREQLPDEPTMLYGDSNADAQSVQDPEMGTRHKKRRRPAGAEKEPKSLLVKLKINLTKWGFAAVPARQNDIDA